MKKTILLFILVGFMVAAISSAAFAFGGGNNPVSHEECPRELLHSDGRSNFESIITNFREQMAQLREEIIAAREDGDYEEFRAKHDERLKLIEEKKEALSDILPEEVVSRFSGKGRELRHNGWHKNSGGFKAQSNFNR